MPPRKADQSSPTPASATKLVVLPQEAFRHCEAIAAWDDGTAVLKTARIPARGAGLSVVEQVVDEFTAELTSALGLSCAWDRTCNVMASAVPLARN